MPKQLLNMAIEIVGFPIKMVIFHCFVGLPKGNHQWGMKPRFMGPQDWDILKYFAGLGHHLNGKYHGDAIAYHGEVPCGVIKHGKLGNPRMEWGFQ